LESVAAQDDLAAVEPVGYMSGREKEEQAGKEQGQSRVAQVERAVGEGIYLPGYRYRLRLRSQDHGYAGKLITPEIARSKGLQAAQGRLLREGRRHLFLG
jgi:hypothetical protein